VGAAPFRLSGLPEGAGAAEDGWGAWQAWGFTPAGPQALHSMGWGSANCPSPGGTLMFLSNPSGVHTHVLFFMVSSSAQTLQAPLPILQGCHL
jgi:hypothetical protein